MDKLKRQSENLVASIADRKCVFCMIASHKIQANIVFENDNIIAFLDNDPINEGHILIAPKKHYIDVDNLPTGLLQEIAVLSQKTVTALKDIYRPDGYSIMQNGGAFNDIQHYHLHIFPRYKNDGFGWKFSTLKYNVNSEIANIISKKLKKEMVFYK